MPINLNRREVATVIAGLHLLAGDAVRAPNYPRTLLATLGPDAQTEYELRYEADEDYVRELIDRINEIAARGAQAMPPLHGEISRQVAEQIGKHTVRRLRPDRPALFRHHQIGCAVFIDAFRILGPAADRRQSAIEPQ